MALRRTTRDYSSTNPICHRLGLCNRVGEPFGLPPSIAGVTTALTPPMTPYNPPIDSTSSDVVVHWLFFISFSLSDFVFIIYGRGWPYLVCTYCATFIWFSFSFLLFYFFELYCSSLIPRMIYVQHPTSWIIKGILTQSILELEWPPNY